MKLKLSLLAVLFTFTLSIFGQNDESDTDSKTFFSAHAGMNGTRIFTEDDTFSNSTRETGYLIGLHYNIFPDYEFSKAYVRIGVEYSSEKSVSGDSFLAQNQRIFVSSELDILEMHFFTGYRFNTDKALDVYIGAGIFGQYVINNPDKQYIVTTENGETYPLFNNNDSSRPFRFSTSGPRASLGFILELGSFFNIGSKSASVSAGYKYGFILATAGVLGFDKSNYYFKLGYEVF